MVAYYECPKCGRRVPKWWEGYFYCKECGPEYIMRIIEPEKPPIEVVPPKTILPIPLPVPTLEDILNRLRRLPPIPIKTAGRSLATITPSVEDLVKFLKIPRTRAREIIEDALKAVEIPEEVIPKLVEYTEKPPLPPIYYMSFYIPRRAVKHTDAYAMARHALALKPRRVVFLARDKSEYEVAMPSVPQLRDALEALEPDEKIRLDFDEDRAWIWKMKR